MRSLLLLLVILRCSFGAKAYAFTPISRFSEIELAIADHPVALKTQLQEYWKKLDEKKDTEQWVLALTGIVVADNLSDAIAEYPGEVARALQYAEHLQLEPAVLYFLRTRAIDQQLLKKHGLAGIKSIEVIRERFTRKMQVADELKLPAKRYINQSWYGYFLAEVGSELEGLKLMREAHRALYDMKDLNTIEKLEAQMNYAFSASRSREEISDVVLRILQDAESFCQKVKVRSLCSQFQYNYAFLLSRSKQESYLKKARELALSAIEKATEIDDKISLAAARALRADQTLESGDLVEAERNAKAAIELFKILKDEVWLADVHLRLARVYIKMNKIELALENLEVSRRLFPKQFLKDHRLVTRAYVDVYAKRKDYALAYHELQAYLSFVKQDPKSNQRAEMARYQTQMSLDLEEERSRTLIMEENMQKAQAKVNANKLREQQNALKLIDNIWLLSGFLVCTAIGGLLWIRRQNHKILELNKHLRENVLQRFLPPVIAEKVAGGKSLLEELPEEIQITALFGRLVGLEHATEDLGPRVTARLLESLMQAVSDLASEHNGCLDKLHRGSFLVLFGAPVRADRPEQVASALRFAESILEEFSQLSEKWPRVEGWQPGLAIGMHCGPALVGIFGGKHRADYTAVGQTVNLAARIEAEAKAGDVLLTEAIVAHLDLRAFKALGEIRLKGISMPQKVFRFIAEVKSKKVS